MGKLDSAQFKALDGKLGGIDGAINKLAEGIAPVDEGETLSENIGKWLAEIKNSIDAGFKLVAEEIARTNDPRVAAMIKKLDTTGSALDESVKANQPNKGD